MNNFKEISPADIDGNIFKLIGKDWMLITATDKKSTNTMTASWGNMGVLWGKNVCTVYIRPQRHTFAFVENSERFSLSFFSEKYRDALKYCGSHSGKDENKIQNAGLSSSMCYGAPIINEASLVIICKKLYADDIKPENFTDSSPMEFYKSNDFHRFYVCEIEKVLKRVN